MCDAFTLKGYKCTNSGIYKLDGRFYCGTYYNKYAGEAYERIRREEKQEKDVQQLKQCL